jgi:hypothetical protein
MHRVLKISTENAFCLHSKERVPYHIILEVAFDLEVDRTEVVSDSQESRNKMPKSGIFNQIGE